MPTDYNGNNVYPVSITIFEDGEDTAAASYSVALEQLADRTAYLNALITGGIDLDFTDATFHGTTTFADGDIEATVDTVTIAALTGAMFLGGNTFEVGATTTVTIGATTDVVLSAGDDLTITVGGNLTVTGADAIDLLSGRVLIDATHIELADNVTLGGGGGDTITVNAGTFDLGATDFDFSDANCNGSFGGAVAFTPTSAAEFAGDLYVSGRQRLLSINASDSNLVLSGALGEAYEYIFPDNPGAPRSVTLTHVGVTRGHRKRFNAQNITTGSNDFVLAYGVRTWNLRNATGKTVVIEFVSDGSAWVVDDWAEGGSLLRNG